ncbi:MAG: biotin--[acetyl-CoA-carboxylase] ligase, partial [Anaerolineaceae bacterium]
RGRAGRAWHSTAGASLTLSLLIRPTLPESVHIPRFTALGGLALVQTLAGDYRLESRLKWPNDVLIGGRKFCGILAETVWQGSTPLAVILGMGVNLGRQAVPDPGGLLYPATSLEEALGQPPDRWEVLMRLLTRIEKLREVLCEEDFIDCWNDHLAFKGKWVTLRNDQGEIGRFRLVEVCRDGMILVEKPSGDLVKLHSAEISA